MQNFLNVFNKASENNILVDELIAATSTDWFLNEVLKVSEETYNKYFNKLAKPLWRYYLHGGEEIRAIENNMYEDVVAEGYDVDNLTEEEKIKIINNYIEAFTEAND